MRSNCIEKITEVARNHPDRWREVLEIALLEGEFSSDQERFLNSALDIHNNYSQDLEAAESVLAGDAFIPLAISSMLDSDMKLSSIGTFLLKASEKIDISR